MNIANETIKKIKVGVLVNLAGGLSLAALKAFTMAMPSLFGLEHFAAYAVVYGLIEIISWGLFNGYGDACIYFLARGDSHSERLLATALRQPFLLTSLVATCLWIGAPTLYSLLWPAQDPVLIHLLRLALPSLPALAMTYCLAEASRARLDMRWAVLCMQFLFPALTLGIGVVVHWIFGYGILAMGWGLLLAPWITLPIALFGASRHFSLRRMLLSITDFRFDLKVARFALPQSVAMFVNQGLPRLDILMLSLFSGPETVAVYGVLAELMLVVRLPKSLLFGVFAPVVAD
ncbi:MAG TPA: hypothetical protein VLM37_07920, partial [Fibrobacteraceae bacterium]|nr:hypothetical protein [Fibrobacteraceae bacterium]